MKILRDFKYTITWVVLCIAAVATLAGCGGQASTEQQSRVDGYTTGLPNDEAYLVDVDGVKCVVYNGNNKGGIDCNWEAYNATTR